METRILVDPERVVRICDYMLRALDHLAPAIEERSAPVWAAYRAAFDAAQRAHDRVYAAHDRAVEAHMEKMKEWRQSCFLFAGKMPSSYPEPYYPYREFPYPAPPSDELSTVGELRSRIEHVRSCGRLAAAPYEITADEARRLDEWESGVVIDRIKALLAEPATQEGKE